MATGKGYDEDQDCIVVRTLNIDSTARASIIASPGNNLNKRPDQQEPI